MNYQPALIVSSLDCSRISALLALPEFGKLPCSEVLMAAMMTATIVAPEEIPADVVTMNSQVLFREMDSNDRYGLTLVYPGQGARPGGVSVFAPVGAALLGKSVGQETVWQSRQGHQRRLRILDIVYQPEANGDHFL